VPLPDAQAQLYGLNNHARPVTYTRFSRTKLTGYMLNSQGPEAVSSGSADPASDGNLRVMFDSQIFCHQQFGGISRYICNIALEMQRMAGVTPLIVAPFHFNEYLERLPRSLVKGRRVRWLEGLTALAYGLSVLPDKFAARGFAPAIVHNTYYFPIKAPAGTRRIVTVYDMIHEKYPKYFAASPFITRMKAASVAAADHVICISESTRRDLLGTYDIPEERVSVTHLGFDPLKSLLTGETANHFKIQVLGADAPYLLYVGSRVSYKNFRGLLDAYAASASLRTNFFLLCFGGGDFTRGERTAISEAGLEGRVRYLGGSDAVLAACYTHASLFVCPSLYEGFGIPVLEAMSLDCPVACSNSSSLPEVVGDAAQLFDPLDRDSIRSAMEAVLESPSAANALRDRGRERRQQFSWQNCAENTIGIYRRVLRG
jgi:glycosyltransferase involved in cell wall biosynthesis